MTDLKNMMTFQVRLFNARAERPQKCVLVMVALVVSALMNTAPAIADQGVQDAAAQHLSGLELRLVEANTDDYAPMTPSPPPQFSRAVPRTETSGR
jgi:hypothetical protein